MRSLPLAVICLILLSNTALAGPVEQPALVRMNPGSPDRIVVVYQDGGGGLFISSDGGDSWGLMCNTAIGETFSRKAADYLVAEDGSLYIGFFDKMERSDAAICSFEAVDEFADQWVSDMALHPTDPAVIYAIVSTGSESLNGIHVLDPATGAWSELGSRKAMLINRLHVVDVGGGVLRFYESGVDGLLVYQDANGVEQMDPQYIIRVSDDNADSWTETKLGVLNGEVRLVAVDPTDPDSLVLTVTRRNLEDDVLVSTDLGANFSDFGQVEELGGLTMAPDGRIWFGDSKERGLWYADSLAATPSLLNEELKVWCLHYEASNDTLYACGFLSFGTVDVTDGTYTAMFDEREFENFHDCGGEPDVCVRCERQLADAYCGQTHFPDAPICLEAGSCGEPPIIDGGIDSETEGGVVLPSQDGDPVDSGPDSAAGGGHDGDDTDDGCSCSAPGKRGSNRALILASLPLIALALSRRRLRQR